MPIQLEIVRAQDRNEDTHFDYIIAKDGPHQQFVFRIRRQGLERITMIPSNLVSQQMALDGQNKPIILNDITDRRPGFRVPTVWDQDRPAGERPYRGLVIQGHYINADFQTLSSHQTPAILRYDPAARVWIRYSITGWRANTLHAPRRMPWPINKYGQIAINEGATYLD